jgi:ubiquinone/menaquinone biosynthesis C-methylase UbiE
MESNHGSNYQEAMQANIAVHSAMAEHYDKVEPHFRPESISRVNSIIKEILIRHDVKRVLDIGCGTGFMISILKQYVTEITGVDITQAMLDRVDTSGQTKIELINSDTGSVPLAQEYYDMATAYSFLDHLYDLRPTLSNTYNSLKSGGVFYADLSPNFYFWDQIKKLDREGKYDPIIEREIKAVYQKDEEIEDQFGINREIFKKAEFQKHVKGGFKEEEIRSELLSVGFEKINFIYHWYLGQAQLINDNSIDKERRFECAGVMHEYLSKGLPLTRHLFKYVGFIAIK